MLAGHETVAKTVSKANALSHGMTSDNLRFVADICTMGAREATRDPAQASGRSYKGVRGDQGTRKGRLHAGRYR
jgi:hypothetical protein